MTSTRLEAAVRSRPAERPDTSEATLPLKLRPPALRRGIVARSALVERLLLAKDSRIVTVVAPAGYGKTTLLAQWEQRETRPTAWINLDREDNDPAALLATVSSALHRAGLVASDPLAGSPVAASIKIFESAARVAAAAESEGAPGILMLDNAEMVRGRASNDVLAELAARLPGTIQLAIASRAAVRLPIAVLRAGGGLLELSSADLAMDRDEAAALFAAVGIDAGDDLPRLVERTEGWPVGLYLAGLAMAAGAPRLDELEVRGDDRFIADYLRHEVIGRLSEAKVSFLTRTSILDRLCGPLCDHLLESTGSTRLLESLQDSNLLIVPLDRTREWYRYHHLLRDLLHSELTKREPEFVADLHRRAADWLEANGMEEVAIGHAQAADDGDRVVRLLEHLGRVTFASGKAETAIGWLEWLERAGLIGRSPEVVALGWFAHALTGQPDVAERWANAMFRTEFGAVVADDDLPVLTRMVRAVMMPGGLAQMHADADAARQGLAGTPEWLPAATVTHGLALLLMGEAEPADRVFADAAAAAQRVIGFPAEAFALGQRAAIAAAEGDWDRVDGLTERALSLVRTNHLDGYATSGIVFAIAARMARHRGDLSQARLRLAQAALTRPVLTYAIPAVAVQARLEMARAYIEVAEVAGARQVVREAGDIIARRPDLGVLITQYHEIKERLSGMPTGPVGTSALTTAELRLLPMLVTHLSFPEIGEHLYVSRHTVKTQAMSIYRKLGVSSRSEAVERARESGLLAI